MSAAQVILWILSFATVTAILYGIGLSKSMRCEQDLISLLFFKGERKIRKALAYGSFMTINELENLLAGTHASLFYSRKKVVVQNAKSFTAALIKKMVEKGVLSQQNSGSQKIYRLQSKDR